jgi:hypothetical protein
VAPAGGALGYCAGTVTTAQCWPSCPPHMGLSGPSTCSGSTFTSATCAVCSAGKVYTQSAGDGLVKYQETGTAGSQFQGSEVVLSADGRIMVAGAYQDNSYRGAVYTYLRSLATNGGWVRTASFLYGNTTSGFFGDSLALSADGTQLIVGEDGTATQTVHFYTAPAGTGAWARQQTMTAAQAGVPSGFRFGRSLALSGDGNTLVIGAWIDSPCAGYAVVLTRSAGWWSVQSGVLSPTPAWDTDAKFGKSIAINHAGNRIAVGAHYDDTQSPEGGSVYIYARNAALQWNLLQTLLPTDPGSMTDDRLFGGSAAMSSTGQTLVIGAWIEATTGTWRAFEWNGTHYNQDGLKKVGTPSTGKEQQGASIAITPNGQTVLVGASYFSSGTGFGYLWSRATTPDWVQLGAKFGPPSSTGALQFGTAVAFTPDGTSMVIGASRTDSSQGAVYATYARQTCEPCPAASYCPTPFQTIACSLGSYCPPNSASETDCAAGFFCQSPISQVACAAGRFSGSRATVCSSCRAGTFGVLTGQTSEVASCAPCNAGSYCLGGAQIAPCTDLGSYCPSGSSVEGDCPQGSYCPSPTEIYDCPAGRFSSATSLTAATDCTTCPAGSYCLGGNAKVYCSGTGVYCPAGTGTANPPCPPGSYCASITMIADCPLGRYGAASGLSSSTDCTVCGAGKYGVLAGRTTETAACAICTASTGSGLYCAPGGTSITGTPCPKGFYCPDVSTAIGCPLGSFGEWTGFTSVTSCTACSVGRYTALTGQSTQEAACPGCPVGRWTGALLSSVTGCTNCAVGKVGTLSGQTSEATACTTACAASGVAPAGGKIGGCTGTSSTYQCWPSCPPQFGLSGPSTCTGSTFTSATCSACAPGKAYTQHVAESLRLIQEVGTPGNQYQGMIIAISADGSVMVQGAPRDNGGAGRESQGKHCNRETGTKDTVCLFMLRCRSPCPWWLVLLLCVVCVVLFRRHVHLCAQRQWRRLGSCASRSVFQCEQC